MLKGLAIHRAIDQREELRLGQLDLTGHLGQKMITKILGAPMAGLSSNVRF